MTSYGLDEWIWLMFKPTQTWPNFHFGQPFMLIGANRWIFWETKSKVGAKSLIRFYIALNLGEFFFPIQNLIDTQSSRFRWYSFVFERTQSRLVWILFRKIDFMRIYLFIDLSASRPVPMPGDSFAVAGNQLCLVIAVLHQVTLRYIIVICVAVRGPTTTQFAF